MVGCNKLYIRSGSGVLKILEMISVGVVFGLFQGVPLTFGDPYSSTVDIGTSADFFAGGVMVAALIITPLLFILYLLSLAHVQQTILELAINFLFAAFTFISASLCMVFYRSAEGVWEDKKGMGITMGVICYIVAILYTLDFLLACKNYCTKPKTPPHTVLPESNA